MTIPSTIATYEHSAPPRTRPTLTNTILPRIGAQALLLGIGADLLLRDGIDGIGFPIWIALLCAELIALTDRADRILPRPALGWMLLACLSASGLAWRDAEMLKVLDVAATAGSLGMAAIALGNERDGLFAERFRDTLCAAAAVMRTMMPGFLPNVAQALRVATRSDSWQSHSRRSFRTAALALAIILIFGSLLRGADPIFASLIAAPDVNVGLVLSHVILIGWFTWLVSGWTNAALGSAARDARAPNGYPFSLGGADLVATLGVLNVLFAVFIIAQLGWLFGGESFLQARTGLTAAEYARHGFFEVVWVAALVIPLLVISRGALVKDERIARMHTMLSVPLLLLLGGIVLSATARMRLYVGYYGLTLDRLYTLVFMLWVTVVLAWLGLTVLRDRGRTFIAGVGMSALAVLIALNLAAPDAVVARFNTSPDHRSVEGVDLRHLSTLSGEASKIAVVATLSPSRGAVGTLARESEDRERCNAARNLLRRWGPSSRTIRSIEREAAWRTWNAGERRALAEVGANVTALRNVQHSTCTR